jgi:hypothetical protein
VESIEEDDLSESSSSEDELTMPAIKPVPGMQVAAAIAPGRRTAVKAEDDEDEFDDVFEQTEEYVDDFDFDFEQSVKKATPTEFETRREVAVVEQEEGEEQDEIEEEAVDSDLEDFPRMEDVVDDLAERRMEPDLEPDLFDLLLGEEEDKQEDTPRISQVADANLSLNGDVTDAPTAAAGAMLHTLSGDGHDTKEAPAVTFIDTGDNSSSSDNDSDGDEQSGSFGPSRIPVRIASDTARLKMGDERPPFPDLTGSKIPLHVSRLPQAAAANDDSISESSLEEEEEEEEEDVTPAATTLMGWSLPLKKMQTPSSLTASTGGAHAIARANATSPQPAAANDDSRSESFLEEDEEKEDVTPLATTLMGWSLPLKKVQTPSSLTASTDSAHAIAQADATSPPFVKVPGKRKPNIGLSAMLAADTDEEGDPSSPSVSSVASTPPQAYRELTSAVERGDGAQNVEDAADNDAEPEFDLDFGAEHEREIQHKRENQEVHAADVPFTSVAAKLSSAVNADDTPTNLADLAASSGVVLAPAGVTSTISQDLDDYDGFDRDELELAVKEEEEEAPHFKLARTPPSNYRLATELELTPPPFMPEDNTSPSKLSLAPTTPSTATLASAEDKVLYVAVLEATPSPEKNAGMGSRTLYMATTPSGGSGVSPTKPTPSRIPVLSMPSAFGAPAREQWTPTITATSITTTTMSTQTMMGDYLEPALAPQIPSTPLIDGRRTEEAVPASFFSYDRMLGNAPHFVVAPSKVPTASFAPPQQPIPGSQNSNPHQPLFGVAASIAEMVVRPREEREVLREETRRLRQLVDRLQSALSQQMDAMSRTRFFQPKNFDQRFVAPEPVASRVDASHLSSIPMRPASRTPLRPGTPVRSLPENTPKQFRTSFATFQPSLLSRPAQSTAASQFAPFRYSSSLSTTPARTYYHSPKALTNFEDRWLREERNELAKSVHHLVHFDN